MKKSVFLYLVFLLVTSIMYSEPIDFWTLMNLYLKNTQTEITDEMAEDYMYLTNFTEHKKYRDDEFEWEDILLKNKNYLSEKINSSQNKTDFIIITGFDFGKYDSQRNGYAMEIGAGTYFRYSTSNETNISGRHPNDTFEKDVRFFPLDIEKYSLLPMNKDDAKTFLNERKNRYGNIDRNIVLFITLESIIDYSSEEYKELESVYGKPYYLPSFGTISGIEAYDVQGNKIGDLVKE